MFDDVDKSCRFFFLFYRSVSISFSFSQRIPFAVLISARGGRESVARPLDAWERNCERIDGSRDAKWKKDKKKTKKRLSLHVYIVAEEKAIRGLRSHDVVTSTLSK